MAEPRDEVVAEAFVVVGPVTGPPSDEAYVFLHRTLDLTGSPGTVPDARVRIVREDGGEVVLPEAEGIQGCVPGLSTTDAVGTCYGPVTGQGIGPGEYLRLEIELPGGGVLRSATTVPGRLDLSPDGAPASATSLGGCRVGPGETLELAWNRVEGSWAYIAETSILGLSQHFGPDVEVDDPLNLLGLALTAEDTTIAFPAEFGVFDRADLEREVALLLQEGLPDAVTAGVAVAAVDRNYVNWVRGGNFNPSGQVRIPSVEGDGTGFFGSATTDSVRVWVRPEDSRVRLPSCRDG